MHQTQLNIRTSHLPTLNSPSVIQSSHKKQFISPNSVNAYSLISPNPHTSAPSKTSLDDIPSPFKSPSAVIPSSTRGLFLDIKGSSRPTPKSSNIFGTPLNQPARLSSKDVEIIPFDPFNAISSNLLKNKAEAIKSSQRDNNEKNRPMSNDTYVHFIQTKKNNVILQPISIARKTLNLEDSESALQLSRNLDQEAINESFLDSSPRERVPGASVFQKKLLKLRILPNPTYCMSPKNCLLLEDTPKNVLPLTQIPIKFASLNKLRSQDLLNKEPRTKIPFVKKNTVELEPERDEGVVRREKYGPKTMISRVSVFCQEKSEYNTGRLINEDGSHDEKQAEPQIEYVNLAKQALKERENSSLVDVDIDTASSEKKTQEKKERPVIRLSSRQKSGRRIVERSQKEQGVKGEKEEVLNKKDEDDENSDLNELINMIGGKRERNLETQGSLILSSGGFNRSFSEGGWVLREEESLIAIVS